MAIFNSYVSLPEGKLFHNSAMLSLDIHKPKKKPFEPDSTRVYKSDRLIPF